jgi:Rps23 Pro-64 3,4-dihydroxylase Tpa1-like proline 4-hydroxylase
MYYNDKRFIKNKDYNIWICNNFVTNEDCNKIVKSIEKNNNLDWSNGWARHQTNLVYSDGYEENDYINYSSWWENKVSSPILIKEISKINIDLKNLFSEKYLFLPEYKVTRLLKGEFMHKHKDNRDADLAGTDKKFQIQCAYTIYLNDFEGGELNYPEINYTYKPKAGDIVIHHSELLHEVLEVKSDKRYTITGWLLNK